MTTPVLFRKDTEAGETVITAVFPTIPCDDTGILMTCYAHIGQHGRCGRQWYHGTKAAKTNEYADLLDELRTVGYDDLRVCQRITPAHREQLRAAIREQNAAARAMAATGGAS